MLERLRTAPAEPAEIVAPAPVAIAHPEAIVDARALDADLLTALDGPGAADSAETAAALRRVLKEHLDRGREEIRRRFLEDLQTGDLCVAEQSFLMDVLVRALAEVVQAHLYPAPNPTLGERFAIVAVGGYGRGELAPLSDIDLLFLLPYKRTPRVEQVVEAMLYQLWDLGLKVGHAVRSVDECLRAAKGDVTIRTGLLESRALWGEARLVDELKRRFAKEVVAGTGTAFVEAKLAERDERHRKMGDSRYVLEPNIKEGKGGLRDLQTLFWIGKYLYQVDSVPELVDAGVLLQDEADGFLKDQSFLLTLRCHLHYLTGRAEERLTFDVQAEIGRRMGYTDHAGTSGVERFMKHYFLIAKDVGNLTRILCAALEAESRRRPAGRGLRNLPFLARTRQALDGFAVEAGRIDVAEDRQFRDRPIDMIRLFHTANRHGLDIHPNALKLITRGLRLIGPKLRRDAEANRLFLDILTADNGAETTLRQMNEAGVLGRFIPDFGRVVAQMQYDMYHVYTVDEHTLFAVGILHRIGNGELAETYPLATRVMRKIDSRRALFVAMFCHDIAKGRGGDHSILGAKVVRQLGPRLGLDAEEVETAEWLVRWHLLMSNTALKRDVEDPKTVQDFVDRVESPERLRLLLALTTADITAVGPGRWNAWKGTLLGQLFHRAKDAMVGELEVEASARRLEAAKDAARAALTDFTQVEVEAFLAKGYPPYWLSFDTETHARHARLMRDADRADRELILDTRVDRDRAVTEVTIYTHDHPGLFNRLAGALAVAGANIVDAKIFTQTDGMALDLFTVQDAATGGAFDAPDKLAKLSVLVDRSLAGKLKPEKELARQKPGWPSRTRVFKVQPRVLIDNEASRTHTVVEINGRDRPGLLYDVTKALTNLGLQISSARIATYGERAVDVFYVKDVFGLKISHAAKLKQVRER
ncbi:MAG: [protein-PII] uridylyltransferase, partial [Deinococcus-Thermus bacterium]|nr:[protein-PII] uridylyltransferase [Deinococcota bacterium]